MKTFQTALIALLVLLAFSACKKDEEDESLDYAALLALSTFRDNLNGTVTGPTGLLIAKCSYGQAWSSGLNNCAGTGSESAYGAQSMAYCAVENSCNDTSTLYANSGPAYTACSNFSVSGVTGWRLPTVAELQGITTALNRTSLLVLFPQTPDDKDAWSTETNSSKTDYSESYGVSFASSTYGQKTSYNKVSAPLYVRCVK